MNSKVPARRVQYFEINEQGHDWVVGDIHGCYSDLQHELDRLGFDATVDRLFSVGDLVDRGPESEQCLTWLAKPWFHAIRGNHEEMFLHYYWGNLPARQLQDVGGQWAVELYEDELGSYAQAFESLPLAIQVETRTGCVGIVHADSPLPAWSDLMSQLESAAGQELSMLMNGCQWSRDRIRHGITTPVEGVARVIVGHNTVSEPVMLGNVHFIDTGAGLGGHLTVMQI